MRDMRRVMGINPKENPETCQCCRRKEFFFEKFKACGRCKKVNLFNFSAITFFHDP